MANCRTKMFVTVFWAMLAIAASSSWAADDEQNEPENLPSPNASEEYDLATLEQWALERNPTLIQAGAQVQMSRGEAIQAGLFPNPSIGYVAEQIGAEGTPGELQGMFIEQELITGGKLRLSREKYAQASRQAELQIIAQQYRVLGNVRRSYYDLLVERRRLALQKKKRANAKEISTTLQELLNTGSANRADVLKGKIQLQRAEAEVEAANQKLQGAWQQLAAVVGDPDLQPTKLTDELDLDKDKVLDRDDTLANLLNESPQLQFVMAEVYRDEIALQRERVEPIPNIRFRAAGGYNFEVDDAVAGVEVGLRIPLYDWNQGTVLQAKAELTRAQAEVRRTELALRQRFAQVYADYAAGLAHVNRLHDEMIPAAEEVYQLYFESFKESRAAWPQVVDAEREYFDLYEEYLDNLLDVRRAEAQIASMLLDDGLEQPPEPAPQGHRDATPKPR